jgi:hypothetical protein
MIRVAWTDTAKAIWAIVDVPAEGVLPAALRISRGRVVAEGRDFGPLDDCILGRDLSLLHDTPHAPSTEPPYPA